MSDTPRTDMNRGYAATCKGINTTDYLVCDQNGPFVLAQCAEELERENAWLTTSLSRNNAIMSEMATDNAKLREALKWAESYVPKRADCETRRMIESLLPNVRSL